MAVLAELRYPTTRLAKLFSALLALILFAFVALAGVAASFLYQILRPARNPASFNLDVMMGHPEKFSFPTADGSLRDGLFFPGLRGAPTIVVCHGYLSQRSDVLTLVTALQDHQFNVFAFDFMGHGSSPKGTTLGYVETAELRSAVQALSTRDDVNVHKFGLWGVDLGGYAALEVATSDPRIAGVAVDDAYLDPRDFVQIQVRHSGLGVIPMIGRATDWGFRLANYPYRKEPPVTGKLARLNTMPKFFVIADDRAELSADTVNAYALSPGPKQMVRNRLSYSDMSDDDRKNYESQIVNFFLQAMPPTTEDGR
jgi:pimeloyl-ACP methyl ester carboxylesterase